MQRSNCDYSSASSARRDLPIQASRNVIHSAAQPGMIDAMGRAFGSQHDCHGIIELDHLDNSDPPSAIVAPNRNITKKESGDGAAEAKLRRVGFFGTTRQGIKNTIPPARNVGERAVAAKNADAIRLLYLQSMPPSLQSLFLQRQQNLG
jgi:hypothetical protein